MGPCGGGQRRGRGTGHGQDGHRGGRGRCFRSGRRQGQMQQETLPPQTHTDSTENANENKAV
ncbi:MAG: hypothetical protein QHJ82_06015 [Verrucomicrobiota bacterium]|nr:hypothetical protein [Verrucomicrobiota bacterium]